jgi:general secretion pathway protein B
MSYILDALKKADAQRERDPARGIHAQPASLAAGPRQSGDRRRAWFWGAGALGLAAVAAVAWYAHRDQEAVIARTVPSAAVAPLPVVAPAAAAIPVTPQPALVATAVMPPPPPAPVATAVMPPAPPVVAVTESARDPRSTSRPMPRARPQQVAVSPPAAATAPTADGAPSAPAAAGSAAAPPAPVMPPPPRAPVIVPAAPVVGLPPDAPKLIITGGVYSTNLAQRMLIVNGQVVNQGADLGSGVTLEEIKPKAAVLTFRGARYSVSY